MIYYTGLTLSLTYIIYWTLKKAFYDSKKIKKIKNKGRSKRAAATGIIARLADQLSPLVSIFSNREKIKYKLIRSGGTFSHLGISEENFLSFEVLFASVIALIMILTRSKITEIIMYPAAAVFFLEFIVSRNTKERQDKIKKELPSLLANTKEYIEQGMDTREVFLMLPNKTKDGPLKEELLRIRSRLGIMKLDTSIEAELAEFSKRIGLEEVDNYVLALTQNEVTGRVTKMLGKQLELLRTKRNLKVNRETQNMEKLSSLASIMIVIMTLTIIIVPMILYVAQSRLFTK